MVKRGGQPYQSACGVARGVLACMAVALVCGAAGQAGRTVRRSAPPSLAPRTMELELERADIRTVLLYLAEVTGKAVVPAPGLSGEINVRSAGMLSTGEVERLLLAALATNGFCVVDDGTCLRVARVDDMPLNTMDTTPPAGGDEERFTLHLEDTELRSVVARLAELTGTTMLPAAGMSGRVTVINPRPVTRDEAVKILYAVLETHGYSVVEYGTYAKVVRASDAAGNPMRLRMPRTAPAKVKEQ